LPAFDVPVRVSTPGGTATAQQLVQMVADSFSLPRLSLRPHNPRNGARVQGSSLLLRERVAGFFPPQNAEAGEILVERRGWNSNLNVLVQLTYRNSQNAILEQAQGNVLYNFDLPEAESKPIKLPIPPITKGESTDVLASFPQRSVDKDDFVNGLRGDLGATARTRGESPLLPGRNGIPYCLHDLPCALERTKLHHQSRSTSAIPRIARQADAYD
jgi:hypothetical protein